MKITHWQVIRYAKLAKLSPEPIAGAGHRGTHGVLGGDFNAVTFHFNFIGGNGDAIVV